MTPPRLRSDTGGRALLLLAWVAIIGLRAPYLDAPVLNPNEAAWTTFGEWMRAGAVPYRDFIDNRAPGILVLYRIAIFLTPWSVAGARLLLLVSHLVTAVLIRRIGVDAEAGWAGGLGSLAFALGVSSYGPASFQAAGTEGFMITFVTAGLWALLRGLGEGGIGWALAWGAAFFGAVSIKQPAGLDGVALVGALLVAALLGTVRPSRAVAMAGWAVVGGAIPLAATAAVFWAWGALGNLSYAFFTYPLTVFVKPEGGGGISAWIDLMAVHPLLWLGGVLAIPFLVLQAVRGRKRDPGLARVRLLVAFWCAASLAAALLGGRPFHAYFIQALPGLALGLGLLVGRDEGLRTRPRATVALVLVLLSASAPAVVRHGLLGFVPGRMVGQEIGERLKAVTHPRERVWVWGYLVEICYYAQRLPAIPEINCQMASGWDLQEGSENWRERTVPWVVRWHRDSLERYRPRYLVDTSRAGFTPLDGFPELAEFRDLHYERVGSLRADWWGHRGGTIDIYRWIGAGDEGMTHQIVRFEE